MQADVIDARVERARELAKTLTKQGIRAVAMTNVDNSGITLVKTVPVSRLERAARFGIGLSPIFDVHLVNDLFTNSAELGGPVGDLRLMPDTLMLKPLASQPGWAWAPTDQYTQEGEVFPCCQRTFARRMTERLSERGITMRLAFEPGRAANVDRTVEIKVVDIVVEIAHQQSGHRLIADAQHLGARADWSYVLEAPSDFVIETQAGDGCAVGIEVDPLGPRGVVAQVLRERHLHTGNHIDDHAHLLSLSRLCRAKTHHQCRRERESPDRIGH